MPSPPKKTPPKPKKTAKSPGVFDVDFFDKEDESENESDEFKDVEDDRSRWNEGDAADGDGRKEGGGKEDDDDDNEDGEFDEEGNEELK